MNVYYFNPDHEHALVVDRPNYTPPKAAQTMRRDLAYIMALLADDGDVVVVDDVEYAEACYAALDEVAKRSVRFCTLQQLAKLIVGSEEVYFMPWGWDRLMRSRLVKAGVRAELLPGDAVLDAIRRLSSRELAVRVLRKLRNVPCTEGHSVLCTTLEEAEAFIAAEGKAVAKAPWSCSGRGVRFLSADNLEANQLRWISNTLREQGAVEMERTLCGVIDFAVEFYAKADGQVELAGLSLFNTVNGAYTGNVLASEADKRKALERYIPLTLLNQCTALLKQTLAEAIDGAYVGPLGVDMMITLGPDGHQHLLCPCIEVNLRHTMGHVALALSKNGLGGTMQVQYADGRHTLTRIINP